MQPSSSAGTYSLIVLNEISLWGQFSHGHGSALLREIVESIGKKISSSYLIKNNWRLVSRLGAFTWDASICVKWEDQFQMSLISEVERVAVLPCLIEKYFSQEVQVARSKSKRRSLQNFPLRNNSGNTVIRRREVILALGISCELFRQHFAQK